MAASKNIFGIGRRPHDEDQLTEMLAWLASAVPFVGSALLELALGSFAESVEEIDLQTQVVVQEGRLDALLLAPEVALVVESKLGSGYGASQLRRYVDWLDSHHADRSTRVLMTLTRSHAPWPDEDVAHAQSVGVKSVARRWEELHDLLEPHIVDATELSAELVREFLEMLSREGLVPIRPLSTAEFGDVWRTSRTTIVRFHDFHRACKSAIAEALGAEQITNSSSDHHDYTWQDYRLEPGRERVLVGIWHTDDGVPIKPAVYTGAPVLWLAVDASKWPNWEKASLWLDANPPEGWRSRGQRWWGRPQAWSYLHDVLGEGTFDEQRSRLASRCAAIPLWLDLAREIT